MTTSWAYTIEPGSPVQADGVQEMTNAINTDRAAAGLPAYSWTTPSLMAGMAIGADHFQKMRDAIQDLWDYKTMGRIPPWRAYGLDGLGPAGYNPVYAQDGLDIRRWLNQYEAAPATVVVKTIKGIHMSAGGDMQFNNVHAWALEEAIPSFGMLVALSVHLAFTYTSQSGNIVSMADVMNWYAVNRETELFVRLYPTPGPVAKPGDQGYAQPSPHDVIDQVVSIRNTRGTNFRRIIPGNEPNLEWPFTGTYHDRNSNSISWTGILDPNFYVAMDTYYSEIYDEFQSRITAGTAPSDIELFYPAMAQGQNIEDASDYCDDGTVTHATLSDGSLGYHWLQYSIELYQRFTWHNYFFSWHAGQQCVSNLFPDWLKTDLYTNGFASRITECAWWPDSREHRDRNSAAGTYPQYNCANTASVGNFSEGVYFDDLKYFITQARNGSQSPASGVAVWILSTGSGSTFGPNAAVDGSGNQASWFSNGFKTWQP